MAAPVILLVEDNPDDVELTRLAFEDSNLGNELVVVGDGQAALDWLFCEGVFRTRDPACKVPSIVLLDLKLPKVSGLEVLGRLRADARTKRVPVVILTSSREEQDLLRGYDLGANSYIRKPVDYAQFTHAVKELGIYWMVLNEPPPEQRHEG